MVDVQEHHLVPVSEQLVLGQSSTDAKADVNKQGLEEDVKMESSASTGTDMAGITVASRVRGVQANDELGKKLGLAYQHLSSPHRNHSQGSAQEEEKIEAGPELKIFTFAGIAAVHSRPENSGPAAMETDCVGDKAAPPAEAFHGMDMETTTETTEDEAYQSRKELPRCDSENLDSSPDYGRREASQGNSRHICKHCAKEFSSGRALGGHMRAHGSVSVEEVLDGVMDKEKQQQQQQQQLSGSMGQHLTMHYFNTTTDSGSDPLLHVREPKLDAGPAPGYSKRSRSNGKEIQSGRSATSVGGRRTKHISGGGSGNKQRGQVAPKNSEEEIGNIKQEEENVAAPMTEPQPSISSDDDGNNEGANENEDAVTDGAVGNVCNVCDLEFDNSKQLNSHKKTHYLYALRRNPKRSRRFMDQDFTAEAAAASLAPAKKTSSIFTSDGNMHECSECKKRFQSWKALFGHMRCHPDRPWRGIRPPAGDLPAKDKQQQQQQQLQQLQQQGTSSADRQLSSSRRKDAAHIPTTTSQESDSGSEAAGRGVAEHADHGKAAAAAPSDNESDTESIEAAYMHNAERQPSTSTFVWMTAARSKRSKRSRHLVRSLQAVTKTAPVPPVTQPENEMERETAMGLMMLGKEADKESWLGNRGRSSDIVRQSILDSALSETEREDYDEQLDNENGSDSEDEEYAHKEELVQSSKGKGKLDALDNVSLCEENEEGGDDCEAGEQAIGSTKPKYICNTCKRIFKSHQALGGHRASHKKVKGCFARTNVSDGVPDNADEEMVSEEFRSDDQVPTDLQEQSQSEGDDKERQFSAFSNEDSGEIMNGSRNKSKGHICTICGRIFNSGQALGGHKRCHYNTKEATSSEATSSTNNTGKLPGAVGGQGKQYHLDLGCATRLEENVHMRPEKSVSEEFSKPSARPLKEMIDLNLPAPDGMDLEAYEMPPAQIMCLSPPKRTDLKGTAEFPSTISLIKSSNAELETGKPKDGYFPLYHTASYPPLVEENNQDPDGSQDNEFRGDEVDFSLRYVQCTMCDSQFSAEEALSKHQKTHHVIMSSVTGLTPISA